jgi:hypothetical protein
MKKANMKDEKPDGHTLVEIGLRKSTAAALRFLRRHYSTESRRDRLRMMRHIASAITSATLYCRELDIALIKAGGSPMYVENFAVFDDLGAIQALHFVAASDAQSDFYGSISSFNDPWETRVASLGIHRIRERMRSGNCPGDALKLEDFVIQRMAVEGNTDFFRRLGQLISEAQRRPEKYGDRNASAGIVQAWLPLRFWECQPDGWEAYRRYRDAVEIRGQVPPSFEQFRSAWQNVRKRYARDHVRFLAAEARLEAKAKKASQT